MKDKIALKEFVEENKSLLTVAGVFAALAAFFSSSKENPFTSFFTFVIFLLLCVELWRSFPKSEKASFNLKIFEYFFMFLVFSVVIQILMEYRDLISQFSFLIFFGIYTLLVLKFVDRFEYFMFVRKIAEKHKNLDPLIRSLGFILVMVLIFLLSFFSEKLVDYMVLSLKVAFE